VIPQVDRCFVDRAKAMRGEQAKTNRDCEHNRKRGEDLRLDCQVAEGRKKGRHGSLAY
jgi:hypothetical protein